MAKPTIAELEEYKTREAKIDTLRAEANELAKRQREQEAEWTPLVQKLGGKARCLLIGAFTLLIEMVRDRVDWKSQYIKVKGKPAADEILAGQPESPKLSITKAA